jgi:parallel beta-helix repeat protein
MNPSSCSHRFRGHALMLAIFIFVWPPLARSEQYFVSQAGSDTNSGRSWHDAWRSPAHAAQVAGQGDIVVLRKGAMPYDGFDVQASGAPGRPVVFRGENKDDPPVFSGATVETRWIPSQDPGAWQISTSAKPLLILEDGRPLTPANSFPTKSGSWHWEDGTLYYRPSHGTPESHEVWRPSRGGGITINKKSWVVIENIRCHVGQGACVAIKGGNNNIVRNISASWYWLGVVLTDSANENLIEDCKVSGNHDGIYIRANSSRNIVRRCEVLDNGNAPTFSGGDRAGIAVGEKGPNFDNLIEFCELRGNGGPDGDPALIAYESPRTILRGNRVHHNFGSGIFVTIRSHGSLVEDNIVEANGAQARTNGYKNIAGLSIRRSHSVTARNNKVLDNHVSPDSRWPGKELGPRGGLEVRGLTTDDMRDIKLIDNVVRGTVGGPDFYVTPGPDFTGLTITPSP